MFNSERGEDNDSQFSTCLLITQIFLLLSYERKFDAVHIWFILGTPTLLFSLVPAAQRVKWLVSFGRRPPAVSLRGAQMQRQTLTGPDNGQLLSSDTDTHDVRLIQYYEYKPVRYILLHFRHINTKKGGHTSTSWRTIEIQLAQIFVSHSGQVNEAPPRLSWLSLTLTRRL